VTINPPNISAGDTAAIVLTYKYSDGTTEVLTPGLYTYQITILEGCSLGQLLVNGISDQFFYDVDLPMYFVADSLASGIATIKVGIVEGGGSAGKIKANNSLQSLPNTTQSCTGFDFNVTKKDIGEVIIGDDCGNPDWACPEGIKRPKFDVKEINIGNALPNEKKYIKNYCTHASGFFGGILEGPTWDPTPGGVACFSNEKGIWQIKYDMDIIFIRAYTVFCPDCFNEEKIIRSKNDVWTKIPQENICDAMADFVADRNYDSHVDYVIEPAIMKHERRHKSDFFTAIATTMHQYPLDSDEKYNTRFLETIYKCKDAPTQEIATNRITNYLETLLEEFKSDLGAVFKDITGEKSSYKNAVYERETTHKHPDVQDEIGEYIKEMNKRIDSINKSIVDETEKLECKVEKW